MKEGKTKGHFKYASIILKKEKKNQQKQPIRCRTLLIPKESVFFCFFLNMYVNIVGQ